MQPLFFAGHLSDYLTLARSLRYYFHFEFFDIITVIIDRL